MNQTEKLGTESIVKLIFKYSVPSTVGMLVNAIYNIVDRMFICKFVGENAMAGLTIAFPIMMVFNSIAVLIGIGGSSLIAIYFGKKKYDEANGIFGNVSSLLILTSALTIAGLLLGMDFLLGLFGASPEVVNYARSYLSIILFGMFFQLTAFTLNSIIRAEGHPNLAMLAMIASAAANIVLDYIFIGILKKGVQGAAVATILGQAVGFIILLQYFVSGKSILKIKLANFRLVPSYVKEICSIGSASFLLHIGMSLSFSFLNAALAKYGGDAAITSLGAINSLFTLVIMPVNGIQQGLTPIIGYNHGAKLKTRANKALFYGIAIAAGFSILLFAAMELFPEFLLSLFLSHDSPTMTTAVNGFRLYIASLPIISIIFLGVSYFQATAQGGKAFFLGFSRQLLFLIPTILFLPKIFGLNGVWLATPVADAFAAAAAVLLLLFLREPKVKSKVTRTITKGIY